MSKYVYAIEINGAYSLYAAADSAQEAKRVALQHVTVRRLDASEVIALVREGKAIASASAELSDDGDEQ